MVLQEITAQKGDRSYFLLDELVAKQQISLPSNSEEDDIEIDRLLRLCVQKTSHLQILLA